jgi:hypothetical protein
MGGGGGGHECQVIFGLVATLLDERREALHNVIKPVCKQRQEVIRLCLTKSLASASRCRFDSAVPQTATTIAE